MENIEVSVVMPCLNEQDGVGVCIDKIREVFAKESINGEIIVADNNSSDLSRQIAASKGARVVLELVPGYGSAYLKGLSEARGKYIIMADSDNTYDFFDIPKFLRLLNEGADFVIGSRFKGMIQKGAMPWANRYIGNPVLSGLTRLFFHTSLSDIHCGMRAFTRQAYDKMRLHTLGMEFATEMVVAALTNDLKTREVPINYYPRKGQSKLQSFADAWRHVRFMLLYCPAWLYFIPGGIGFIAGMFVQVILLRGPFLFMGHMWDVHPAVFASVLTLLSYQLIHLGIYAHTFAVGQGFLKEDRFTLFLQRHFNLEKWLLAGFLIFCAGIAINLFIFVEWISHNFGPLFRIRESVFAMTLLVIGLQTIFSSFFISLLSLRRR
jgi:glycosyltransferase involved in cell wall biosynthesis